MNAALPFALARRLRLAPVAIVRHRAARAARHARRLHAGDRAYGNVVALSQIVMVRARHGLKAWA